MALIADGLMIVAGLTAGLYCLVLSRRLRRLSDAGQGIGAQIRALSDAIAETRAAVTEARGAADEASGRLGREMRKAKELLGELRTATAAAEAARKAPEPDYLRAPPPRPAALAEGGDEDTPPEPRRSRAFETVFDEPAETVGDTDGADEDARGDGLELHASEIAGLVGAVAGFDERNPAPAVPRGAAADEPASPPRLNGSPAGSVLRVDRVSL